MKNARHSAQYLIGYKLAHVWTAIWMAVFAYLFLDLVNAVPIELTVRSVGYVLLMLIPALPIGYVLGWIVSYTLYKIGSAFLEVLQ